MFQSCEEVIEIPLEESGTQLVIEAKLQEGSHPFNVAVSYSSSYYDSSLPTPVIDAEVTLTDDEGIEYSVPHLSNGIYSIPFQASAGEQYILKVQVGEETYQAVSFLPDPVSLNELIPEYQPVNPGGNPGYQVFVRFNDPAGEENYYRLRHSVDGNLQNSNEDYQVTNDNIFDGGEARLPLFQQTFESGSLVGIELIHFDQSSYDYFNSLSDIVSTAGGPGGATAAPGNPVTNWSGGCLGYFSAYSSDTLSIRIP